MQQWLLLALILINGWSPVREVHQQIGSARPAGIPSSPQGTTAPVPTGAISGTVVDAVTHRPIAGAIVNLRPATGGPALARIPRQLTDPDGRFVFRALAPSDGYVLTATRFGYLDGGYGQNGTLSANGRIPLTDGQWVGDANVTLWKPNAISGTVVDEYGEPVVAAYVRVIGQQIIGGQVQLVAGPVARTDDRGEYRISGLTPGKYVVSVPSVEHTVPAAWSNPGGATELSAAAAASRQLLGVTLPPRTNAPLDVDGSHRLLVGNYVTPPPVADGRTRAYPIVFFPNALTIAGAAAVELGVGDERRGIDFQLQPVQTARVLGQVDAPPGVATGMSLRLVPAGLEDLGGGSEAATALVAADGTFGFLNVPAGSYTIDARRSTMEFTMQTAGGSTPGLPASPGAGATSSMSGTIAAAPPGTNYSTRTVQGNNGYWGRTKVVVDSGDVPNIIVTLHKAVAVYGQFVFEGNTAPPGGSIAVFAEPANASPSLGMPRSLFPQEDDDPSEFTIEGLQPGEYVLRCATPPAWTVKSITAGSEDYTRRPIDASNGRDLANVIVTLTDKAINLRGTVQTDQSVASYAAVIVFPIERELWTRYGFSPSRLKAVAVTANGFSMDGLPAGEYYVAAVDAAKINAWQDPAFLERASSLATRVSLQWGDTKTVDVKMVVVK